MKKRGIVAVIVLLLIGLDQLVKNYVVQQIPLGEVRSWIPNLVSLVGFWTDFDNRGRSGQLYRQNESRFCGGYVSPRLYQLCDFQCG